MEGLIPMVFKVIKKNRIRKQYSCLSTVTAAQTYYGADDLDHHDHHRNNDEHDQIRRRYGPPVETRGELGGHRRFGSAGINGGYNFSCDWEGCGDGRFQGSPTYSKQVGRSRSHRMFSCIKGAAYN